MPQEFSNHGFRTFMSGEQTVANYVWDTNTLTWVAQNASSGGTGSDVNVTNSSIPVTQAGSWTVTATGPLTDAQLRAAAVPVSLASTTITGSVAVTGALTDSQLRATAVPVSGTFWQATQPVSLASLPALATGANTIGAVNVNGTVPVSGTFWQSTQPVSIAATVAVSGPLTDTQLRATAVPISASSLPLPTGAATETTLSSINTKTPSLGQAVMASSQPVVIASNQSAVPVSGTFWQATQPVSLASLPALATGANTIGAVNVNGTVPVSGTFWQATQPVSIAATVTTTEAPPTTVAHAQVTVANAGTRVQFGSNACKAIVVKASAGNSGTIYVGGSTVTSANGFPLAAGDTVALDISNTNVVWIDASTNGQSVAWMSNS